MYIYIYKYIYIYMYMYMYISYMHISYMCIYRIYMYMSSYICIYIYIYMYIKTIAPFGPQHRRNTLSSTYHYVLYISLASLLLLKVCKSDCSIVTLLLRFYFLASYIICNVRDID